MNALLVFLTEYFHKKCVRQCVCVTAGKKVSVSCVLTADIVYRNVSAGKCSFSSGLAASLELMGNKNLSMDGSQVSC